MSQPKYIPPSLKIQPIHGIHSCVDDYFCTSEATASLRHILLGPLSLIMLLFSLFTNILIVSVLGNRHLSSAANAYLTTAILSDAIHCVVFIVGVVMPSMTFNPNSQIRLYRTIVAYLVPIGEPFGHMLDLLTALCLICAAIIRLKSHLKHQKMIKRSEHHLRHHHSSMTSNTRRLHLLTAVTSIFIFCAPTFVRYKVVESLHNGNVHVRVEYTALFKQESNWSVIWNLYDTVLLAIATVLLVILVTALSLAICKHKISFSPRKKFFTTRENIKMSSSTLSDVPVQTCESAFFQTQDELGLTPGSSVVKRIKMEVRILCMYTFLWIFPAAAYMMFKVILVTRENKKFNHSNAMKDQVIRIGIICKFAQIMFLFVRTLACLFGGVYIRRILKNMFCVCIRPKNYHHVMSYGDMALLHKLDGTTDLNKSTFSRHQSSYSMRLPLMTNDPSLRDCKNLPRGPYSVSNLHNLNSTIADFNASKILPTHPE